MPNNQLNLSEWIPCIAVGTIGLFFLIMTYTAVVLSKRKGRFISGFPCVGGILILIAFLISPCKWLSILCILDYGIWLLPYSLIKQMIAHKHNQKMESTAENDFDNHSAT